MGSKETNNGWNRGKENYNKNCKLCEEEVEDIVHFTTKCKKLEKVRNYDLLDKDIEDPEERMRTLLFRNERKEEIGKMIKKLWDLRKQIMEEIEEKKKNDISSKNQQTVTQGCKEKKGKGKTEETKRKQQTTQGCKKNKKNKKDDRKRK